MKKITIVWTITLVLIVSGLTIIGFKIKADNIDNIMEKSLITKAEKYLGLYPSLFPALGKEIRLDAEKLKSEGYDPELEKDCTGYVIVKNENSGFKYKAYINCPNYTTKGYSKE